MDPNLSNVKSRRDPDDILKLYRESHQAVARYRIVFKNTLMKKEQKVLHDNLTLQEARAIADEFNQRPGNGRMGADFYDTQLINPEEALAAVKAASLDFWADDYIELDEATHE